MSSVRPLFALAALAAATGGAVAAPATSTERAKHATAAHNDDLPLDGLLILAGVVGLLVFLAWLGARIGDNRSHVID